jgi:hypothetical protein
MILEATHFQTNTDRNIHIFRDGTDIEHVEEKLSTIARELGYSLASLHGDRLTNEAEVLRELAETLGFPSEGYGPNYENLSWNGALDFLRDMRWPPRSPARGKSSKGHIILYSNPSRLISADALEFATLLDALGTGSRVVEGGEMSIHIVVGPMTFRHEYFSDLLSVSRQFCEECQNSDEESA